MDPIARLLLQGASGAGATYQINANTASVNEGGSVTFTIVTTGVSDSSTLYWTTTGTATSPDFGDNTLSGSFVVNSGSGSVLRAITADKTTEGPQTFALQVRTGSTSGPIVATSIVVTINDTSQTPPFTVTGGTVQQSGAYTYHYFNSSTSYTITGNPAGYSFDWLLVAGGGGGGGSPGNGRTGGGGAGGVRSGTVYSAYNGTFGVTIGGGGFGPGTGSGVSAGAGSASNCYTPDNVYRSVTGGGPGGGSTTSNKNGGSGGGGQVSYGSGGTGISGEGFNGGGADAYSGGGGGGANAAGTSAATFGGYGGSGITWYDGLGYGGGGGGGAGYFGGGGGGGYGGYGGGGNGGNASYSSYGDASGSSGTYGKGGGGGGQGYYWDNGGGGAGYGGSGFFALRYLTP